MKTNKTGYYLLLMGGAVLMAIFGSEITRAIAPSNSWAWHVILPGYSVGLIMISASMVTQLRSQLRDLQSKVEKLESDKS